MIDVTKCVVDPKKQVCEISGVDLDELWVQHDEPEEDTELPELTYKFDTSLAGVRKYLYLVTKNNKAAAEHKYMDDRLAALVGQTIHLSSNFLAK